MLSSISGKVPLLRDKDKTTLKTLMITLLTWKDQRGQDLIEYALMAGFVAVSAGAIMPDISTSISTVFSKVASVMAQSAS